MPKPGPSLETRWHEHAYQIALWNKRLNTLVAENPMAREQAKGTDRSVKAGAGLGPLGDLFATVKDTFEVVGMPATAGTVGRRGYMPTQTASLIRRLRRCGVIILGKSNAAEWAAFNEADNRIYGRTANPYEETRTSGGSSGGPAGIAVGIADFDVNSDLRGSTIQPSGYCGVVGLTLTPGSAKADGHVAMAAPGLLLKHFATFGVTTRSVAVAKRVLLCLLDPDLLDPFRDRDKVDLKSLRVAWYTDNGVVSANAAATKAVHSSAEALRQAGAAVTAVTTPPRYIKDSDRALLRLFAATFDEILSKTAKRDGTSDDQVHRYITEEWPRVFAEERLRRGRVAAVLAIVRLGSCRLKVRWFMRNYDVIITPVTAGPAPKPGETFENIADQSFLAFKNVAGLPAGTVRASTEVVDGKELPVGVQVMAKRHREDVVLAVLEYLESQHGFGYQAPLTANAEHVSRS